MTGAAAVKKAEEEKRKKAEPSPFSQMAPEGGLERGGAPSEEKKKAPAFRPGSELFGDELMISAPTLEQQARASHEAGVKREMRGLERAKARKRVRKRHHGGKVKQRGN